MNIMKTAYFNMHRKTYEQLVEKLKRKIKDLFILNYDREELPELPASLIKLTIIDSEIKRLPDSLPPKLSSLIVQNCKLETIPENLPLSLETVSFTSNHLTAIPYMYWPQTLTSLDLDKNEIIEISSLPHNLQRLDCSNNKLTSLPDLPSTLLLLYVNNNNLTSLPLLPPKLEMLYCNNNLLEYIPHLPDSLTNLYCEDNPLKEPPRIPFGVLRYNVDDPWPEKLAQFNERIEFLGWKPRTTFNKKVWDYVDDWYDNYDTKIKELNTLLTSMGLPETDKVPTMSEYKKLLEDFEYNVGGKMYKKLGIGKNWQSAVNAQQMLSLDLPLQDIVSLSGWTDPLFKEQSYKPTISTKYVFIDPEFQDVED